MLNVLRAVIRTVDLLTAFLPMSASSASSEGSSSSATDSPNSGAPTSDLKTLLVLLQEYIQTTSSSASGRLPPDQYAPRFREVSGRVMRLLIAQTPPPLRPSPSLFDRRMAVARLRLIRRVSLRDPLPPLSPGRLLSSSLHSLPERSVDTSSTEIPFRIRILRFLALTLVSVLKVVARLNPSRRGIQSFVLIAFAVFALFILVPEDTSVSTPDPSPYHRMADSLARSAGFEEVARHTRVISHLPFRPPVADHFLTSPFGLRTDPITSESRFHGGVDLAVPSGSDVYPPSNGTVKSVNYTPGYGKQVVIQHDPLPFETRLGHLSKVLVEKGQSVDTSTVVALSGSSGRSTGPHVHFEIRSPDGLTDPADVYDWSGQVDSVRYPVARRVDSVLTVHIQRSRFHASGPDSSAARAYLSSLIAYRDSLYSMVPSLSDSTFSPDTLRSGSLRSTPPSPPTP